MDREIKVGIADMKMTRREGSLITYALGSCIGISFYDPDIKLAALLHIMLPECKNPNEPQVFKYADIGIRETLRKMAAFGGVKQRFICKIAGGAQMFAVQGTSSLSNIGERNIVSVRNILRSENIRLLRQEVGANYARTMLVDVPTGSVTIRTFGRPDIVM